MKIAILICLSISSALIAGCSSKEHTQVYSNHEHTNQVAVTGPESTVDSVQVASPEPQNIAPEVIPEKPKPIVRHTAATLPPAPPQALATTETDLVETTPVQSAPPVPAPTVVAEPKSNWIPNEVHLIRGNEIISGLQRDIGRKPTPLEMQQRLQTHMGLSAIQADQIIVTLGLQ